MKISVFYRRGLVLLAALIMLLPASVASAHSHVTVGDYDLEIGLRSEPALQDEINGLELVVLNTITNQPVTGLEVSLSAEIVFGASAKVLKIEPIAGEDGAYTAAFIPTEVGDYTWHIYGNIEDTPVDVTMTSSPTTFASVVPRAVISFPGGEPSLVSLRADLRRAQQTAMVAIILGAIGVLFGITSLAIVLIHGRGAAR